ncbi:protein mono-ADP-ribosyltransferase PARP14-like [Crassostrea virginica]
MNKMQIQIEEYYPRSDESEGEIEVSAILVTSLPPDVTDKQIKLFFKNSKKSGGGEVQKVEYDQEARSAVVTFKDAEVVPKVLEKHKTSPLMINKQKVDVQEYCPPENESGESSEEEHEEAGAIKVTKLPPGTTEEAITSFFENRKKSGGGEVEKVEYDEANHSAVVWFTEAEAVSRVLQKVPLLLNKKQIYVEGVCSDGQRLEKEEEKDRGPLCTIEVSGMKDTTSKDSVEFYFENKRSGGGAVEEVKGEMDDGVLLVTFVDEKTVERVLQRTHKLEGATLQVKRYEPPKPIPMYPNKVLIKNVNPETTVEEITNFLEAKTKEEVRDVAFRQEEGIALVTFVKLSDFSKLEETCQKKTLKNHYLSVKRVPVSNCICVSGFSQNTSESTLEYYFENERKSGGNEVTGVNFNKEDNTCLIYFKDHTVCEKVCQRPHVVEKQNLIVQIYHECLGQPFNPAEGPRLKTPNPLVLRELDLTKMKFVYKSPEFKEALDKQATMAHGKIKWSKKPASELTVECTLTKDVPDCKKLVKTWEKDMEGGIKRLLEELQVELISVLQELWQKVLEEIEKVNVADPAKVDMAIEKGTYTIVIVGYKEFVESLQKTFQQIISVIEDEIQKQKKQIIEKLSLKHHQVLLLNFDNFKEAIEMKHPGLKVTTNLKDGTVTLEGLHSDVTMAKLFVFERCYEICEASAGKFSKNRMEYIKEVKSKVLNMLKEKDNMSCFEFKEDEIVLYAFSDEKAVKAAHLLKDNITESPIEVLPNSVYLLTTDKWENEVKNIESMEEFKGLLKVITVSDQKKIIIVTFCELVGRAREFVENFFEHNTILSTSIDVDPCKFKYLELHHSKTSEEIGHRFKDQQVQISIEENKFIVKGTQTGVAQAKLEIDSLISKIISQKHTLQKPGFRKYIKNKTCRGYISKVQTQNKCFIQISEKSEIKEESFKSTSSELSSNGYMCEPEIITVDNCETCTGNITNVQKPEEDFGKIQNNDNSKIKVSSPETTSRGISSIDILAEYTTKCGITIKVYEGDLSTFPVDVIVNSSNQDLMLQGGLAAVLVKKGGNEIQKECTEHVKKKGKLSEGEIFCSESGTLSCNMIIHTCSPVWQNDTNQESEHLTECVQAALEETDKREYQSIAFPALSSGIFGYPAKQATSVIVKAVKSYLKDKKVSHVKEIILCDVKAETVKCFKEALQQAYKRKVKVFNKDTDKDQKEQDFEFTTGNISVKLIKGQIGETEADVIVNTASPNLNLRQGAVSNSIVNLGGDTIQQECRAEYPNGINYGEIAITKAGKLDCMLVFHGALPQWDNIGNSIKILRKFLKSCLQESQKQNMETIAFPAIGTGCLAYPRDIVAEEMCNAIVDFSKENSNTSLKKVLFVVYEKDLQTIQSFETRMKLMGKISSNTNIKLRHGKLSKEPVSDPLTSDPRRNTVIEDNSSSVAIVVYAKSQSDIDAGIQSLEKILDDVSTKIFHEKHIHKFTEEQMLELQNLSMGHEVEVEIDKNQGKIVLMGARDQISAASDCAQKIFRNADSYMQTKAQAKLVSDMVQWSYIDTDGTNSLKEYPLEINLTIETAYRNQEKEARFSDENGTEYIINFSNMEEYPSDDVKDVASVIRRDKMQKSSFEPPKEWSPMEEKDNLVVAEVYSGTSEYSDVIQKFLRQVGKLEIIKLERIQNKMLYQQYLAKKKLLDSQNPQGTQNERELWHGTAPEAVNSINSFGFNRSYCGKNATAFGEGVYFAVSAGYSVRDIYSKPDTQGHKRIYLCNVLTGEYTKGRAGMRVPPTKGRHAHILYDSVVERTNDPEMFIIFNDTQGYPAYLITFK